jgi:hypothetical protein
MGNLALKYERTTATCDLGHPVEVFFADGVISTRVHRDPEPIVDPISGHSRQTKCPACEAVAKVLIRTHGLR